MNKIDFLMNRYPNEFNELVNKLYEEKKPKKKKNPKTNFKFRVLGKLYDDDIVTKNYVSFISDISKIHPFEMFVDCIGDFYIFKKKVPMRQLYKENENFYVKGKSSTKVKIRHIKKICKKLGLELRVIDDGFDIKTIVKMGRNNMVGIQSVVNF
jgi:hypothetical protein